MVTSEDVARRAGVSRSTVSYILNGHADRFSGPVQLAVRNAVRDLGYVPQAAGRSLVRGESDLVIASLPSAPNGLMGTEMAGLTDALAARGLSLLFRASSPSLDSFSSIVRSLRPRTFLALAELTHAERRVLENSGVHVYDFAGAVSGSGGSQWRVGRIQVEHLLGRGYTDIAYARLAEAQNDVMMRARESGAREACRDAGLPQMQVLSLELRADADLRALTALPHSTGVACYNDDTAAAALGAAHALGRDVPGDLGFIGMDDTPIATQVSPRLTTIAYWRADFVEMLADSVAGGLGPEVFDERGVLEGEVVQGGTT
ncbi:LacI family DNA-binding transcriptional regulator [Arthrobacter sp. D2-10]